MQGLVSPRAVIETPRIHAKNLRRSLPLISESPPMISRLSLFWNGAYSLGLNTTRMSSMIELNRPKYWIQDPINWFVFRFSCPCRLQFGLVNQVNTDRYTNCPLNALMALILLIYRHQWF